MKMEEQTKGKHDETFEKFIGTYENLLKDVRKETYEKFPEEAGALIKFLDNWIELIPSGKDEWMQHIHSIPGVLLFHSWKMANWIGYEILNGKYFEAFKNIRFIFEASVLSVIMEDAIERQVYEKWETLSSLDLKAEILQ